MVDEAELDEELERMQQEALDKTMLKAPVAPVSGKSYMGIGTGRMLANTGIGRVPVVEAPKKTVEDEEEDLRKMREEMMIAS